MKLWRDTSSTGGRFPTPQPHHLTACQTSLGDARAAGVEATQGKRVLLHVFWHALACHATFHGGRRQTYRFSVPLTKSGR